MVQQCSHVTVQHFWMLNRWMVQHLEMLNCRPSTHSALYWWCTVVSPTSKYDGPKVENVARGRSLNATFSTEGHHIWMLHKRPCFICFVTVSIAFWLAFLTEIWSYCVLALDSRIAMRWWMLWGRCLKWYIYVPPTCIVSVIIQTLNNVVLSMPLDRPFRTRLLLLVWPSCSFTF